MSPLSVVLGLALALVLFQVLWLLYRLLTFRPAPEALNRAQFKALEELWAKGDIATYKATLDQFSAEPDVTLTPDPNTTPKYDKTAQISP